MKKILIIDIETTGFLNQGGSIVEIGIVELNMENGEIKTVYDSLCRESILTAKHKEDPYGWIFRNSDLTPDMVRNAKPFDEVKQEVQEIINKYPEGATAFNNRFDFDYLKNRGITFLKELQCPMLLSTNICKIPNTNGYSGFKWPSVEEAWKHFFPDKEYTELHRGADDAKHEAMIVYELYKQGYFVLATREDMYIMPFGKFSGWQICDVDPSYLMHIYDKGIVSIHNWNKVYWYIKNNMKSLQNRIKSKTS